MFFVNSPFFLPVWTKIKDPTSCLPRTRRNRITITKILHWTTVNNTKPYVFLKKKLEIIPFCGITATNPCFGLLVMSVLTFKARVYELYPHLCALLPACNRILRFTWGVTPADLLVASMASKPFPSTYLYTSIGGDRGWICACHFLKERDQVDDLPTKLT